MSEDPRNNRLDFIELPAASTEALAAARTFFSEVFGWTFTPWGDDYCDTRDSGVACGINADPSQRSEQPLVVIFTSDLDAAYARVVTAGGEINREIFGFPGGRRFQFRDPAGNEIAVWSDRESADAQDRGLLETPELRRTGPD